MELSEAIFLILSQSLIRSGDRGPEFDRGGEGRDEGGDDVVDGGADAETVQGDDVAGDEGVVGVVDEVGGWGLEVLIMMDFCCEFI